MTFDPSQYDNIPDADLIKMAQPAQQVPAFNPAAYSNLSDDDLQKMASQSEHQNMNTNATIAQSTNPVAALTGYGANIMNQIPGLHELGSAEAAALGSGKGDTFGDRYNNLEQAQQSMREAGKQLYPTATTIGDVGANLATLGGMPTPEMKGLSTLQKIGAGTATGTAYGAASGAGDVDAYKPTDQAIQQRLGNAKTGAEVGAVVGGGAQAVLGGAGALANSFTPDADRAALAQKAMDEHGIPISATQLTPADQGKFTKGLTSAASEVPFNQAGNFAKQQRTAYNTAIARTFGEDISGENGGKITPDVISNAYDNIGAKFDAAFKGKQIPINADKLNEIKGIMDEADQYSTAPNIVQNAASKFLDSIGDDGTISGEKLNNLRSLYGRLGKAQNDASPYIRQLRDSVIDLVDDPVAREQYKNLKIIDPLAAKSPDGYVQPSMLNNRLISSRYFPDYTQGGGGALGDLGRIGNTFLKDTLPNSGTAFRSKLNQLIYEAPLAMGTAAATGSLPAGAIGAATAIPLARGVTGLNTSQSLVRNLVNRGLGQAAPEIAEDAPKMLLSPPPIRVSPAKAIAPPQAASGPTNPAQITNQFYAPNSRALTYQPKADFEVSPEGWASSPSTTKIRQNPDLNLKDASQLTKQTAKRAPQKLLTYQPRPDFTATREMVSNKPNPQPGSNFQLGEAERMPMSQGELDAMRRLQGIANQANGGRNYAKGGSIPSIPEWSRLLHKARKKGYNISASDRTNPAEVARVMRIAQ